MSTGEVLAWAAIGLLLIAAVTIVIVVASLDDPRAQDPCTDTVLAVLELECPHPDHELVAEGRGFCVCKEKP